MIKWKLHQTVENTDFKIFLQYMQNIASLQWNRYKSYSMKLDGKNKSHKGWNVNNLRTGI